MSKYMAGVVLAMLLLCGATSGQTNFTATSGDEPQDITVDLKSEVTITVPPGDGIYVTFKVNGNWETEVHSHTGTEGSNPPYVFGTGAVISAVRIEYRTGGSGTPLSVTGTIN